MGLSPCEARDGNRILRFLGVQLAHATSERPGVARWSELTAYRTAPGQYLLQKIGRTRVAHRPECRLVNHRMPSWLEAREEGKVHRLACLECAPLVGDQMDPHTRLEVQRYTVRVSDSLEGLVDILMEGRSAGELPAVVATLVEELLQ